MEIGHSDTSSHGTENKRQHERVQRKRIRISESTDSYIITEAEGDQKRPVHVSETSSTLNTSQMVRGTRRE